VGEGLRVRLRVPRHLDCDGALRHGHHPTDRPARIRADRRTREDGDDAEGAGRPRHPRIPSSPRLRHRGGPTRPDRDRSRGRARDVRPLPGGPDARGDRGGPNANGRRTKRDTAWTPIKVYRILHNPVYAGFLRWDGIVRKADHDPVVPIETFNEAQERLRSRALPSNAHAPPVILEA